MQARTFTSGKPQPTEPFLGGWVCCGNVNNIYSYLRLHPDPCCKPWSTHTHNLSSYQILNSVTQYYTSEVHIRVCIGLSILVHFLTNKILRPMRTLMCTSLVNHCPYLVKPATRHDKQYTRTGNVKGESCPAPNYDMQLTYMYIMCNSNWCTLHMASYTDHEHTRLLQIVT